jgi:hypothetical protein
MQLWSYIIARTRNRKKRIGAGVAERDSKIATIPKGKSPRHRRMTIDAGQKRELDYVRRNAHDSSPNGRLKLKQKPTPPGSKATRFVGIVNAVI